MQAQPDVAIIGAGPSGAVAAAMLSKAGHSVQVLERSSFPRFSIGESLLPQCLVMLEEAGLLDSVQDAAFQFKDGAVFTWGPRSANIHFPHKSTAGPDSAFQVRRGRFDQVLIEGAQRAGAEVQFGATVTGFTTTDDGPSLEVSLDGIPTTLQPRFVLDASGYGRVLPRLLGLDLPSDEPPRRAVFKHVQQEAWHAQFDRNKILIAVHPEHREVWYWVIPLVDGGVSIGLVGPDALVEGAGDDAESRYRHFTDGMGWEGWFDDAVETRPAAEIKGYASAVRALHGPGFALLGNAAEFIDPIFSSGVTIAMKSASLAAATLDRQLRGETVDWEADYSAPLNVGVDAFRACVQAWYDGKLQNIIFSDRRGDNDVTRHLTAILAGYAWDTSNPFVRRPGRFIQVIDRLIARG